MTILAYNRNERSIACDSRFTTGERKQYGRKFKELADGRVILFAGDVREGRKAIRYIERNAALPADLLTETVVVVFDRKRKVVLVYDEHHVPERVRDSEAWGSGADFAIGALDAGASAEQAVKITCRRSTSCGGKIHVFNMED